MQPKFAFQTMRGFLLGALLLSVSCGSGAGASDDGKDQNGVSGGGSGAIAGSSNGASGAQSVGGAVASGAGGDNGAAGSGATAGSMSGANTAGSGGAGAGGSAAGGSGAGGQGGGIASSGGAASGAAGSSGAGSSGAAGSSGGAALPPSVTSLFPAIGASGVCLDAPLTITFSSAPTIGSAGKIAIYAASNATTPVDSIDLTSTAFTDTIGGQSYNLVRPVFVDGNQAVVYFHQHKLAANTKYFVTVSSGTFVNAQKAAIGTVTSTMGWTFTTGAAPTASASMAVDRTGTGNFCTVQGAFDAVPANSAAARTITVAAANYHEILYLSGKKNITLHGADRAGTLIEYANNDALNSGTAKRPLFFANGTTGLSIENLTIYNTTPQDGTQAEALRVSGDQVILRDSNFKSLQDTLLLDGRVYVVTSYVEGNVDFVWGGGVTYFDRSEIKTVGRSGAIVQARNGAGAYGYVFVDSKLTAGPGVSNQVLARIDATQFPYSHVAYVNCAMTAISAKGWTITPAGTTQTGNLRFWEYGSTNASGAPLNVSGRDPAATAINATQAATMRDKATVLGGWNPAG